MSSSPQPTPPRPSLEDLLRFKRAERPSLEFWTEFDRGLRQKQLAALMKKPQGWARWRPAVARSMRWAVPCTAAAAVALVVVQIPFSAASRNTPVEVASRVTSIAEQPRVSALETQRPVAPVEAVVTVPTGESVASASASVPTPVSDGGEIAAVVVHAERTLPWSAASLGAGTTLRPGAASFTAVSSPEPRRPRSSWTSRFNEISRDLGAEQSVGRTLQLASLQLPVAQQPVAAAADRGAYAASAPAPRSASERDFRDLESRFGVTGSSLSIKF